MKNPVGKIAFVTGGSSGIGLATAKLLATRGAHVVLLARRQEALAAALGELAGTGHAAYSLDVADAATVAEVMERAVAEVGPPDLLVNSAGISHPDYFENIDAELFDRVVRVNLHGTRHTCAALAEALKARRGHVVNVASVAGFLGVFGFTAYSASKFGVVGFSEALRAEWKPHGVGVSVLCPPDVDTPMLVAEEATKPPETKAISAGARVMSAERVAEALLAGVAANRFMIVPGLEGKFTHAANRLWPGLARRITDRLAARGAGR